MIKVSAPAAHQQAVAGSIVDQETSQHAHTPTSRDFPVQPDSTLYQQGGGGEGQHAVVYGQQQQHQGDLGAVYAQQQQPVSGGGGGELPIYQHHHTGSNKVTPENTLQHQRMPE